MLPNIGTSAIEMLFHRFIANWCISVLLILENRFPLSGKIEDTLNAIYIKLYYNVYLQQWMHFCAIRCTQ